MTLGEFKAWFEGFSEGIDEKPNAKQWARIRERVGQIDGKAVEVREVIRWLPSWPYVPPPIIYTTTPTPQPYVPWMASNSVSQTEMTTTSLLSFAGQSEAQSLSS